MARKMCADCGIRPSSAEVAADGIEEMCQICYDEAGWVNQHSDNAHDTINRLRSEGAKLPDWAPGIVGDMDHCWVCHPELNRSMERPRKGHKNGIALSHTSHAGHKHPATKAARAACRKANQT